MHARQARKLALQLKWIDDRWDFKDFGTETAALTNVWEWLDTVPSEQEALSSSDV